MNKHEQLLMDKVEVEEKSELIKEIQHKDSSQLFEAKTPSPDKVICSLSFSSKVVKQKLEKQFAKVLEIFENFVSTFIRRCNLSNFEVCQILEGILPKIQKLKDYDYDDE